MTYHVIFNIEIQNIKEMRNLIMALYAKPKEPKLQLAFVYQGQEKLIDELNEEGIEYRGRIAHRLNHTELSYGDVIIIDNFRVVNVIEMREANDHYDFYESMDDYEQTQEEEREYEYSSDNDFDDEELHDSIRAFGERLRDEFQEEMRNMESRAREAHHQLNEERQRFQQDPKGRTEAYKERSRKEAKQTINRLGDFIKGVSDRL